LDSQLQAPGPGVVARAFGLFGVVVAFAALDAWAQAQWLPPDSPPTAIVGALVLLAVVGTVGWFFVGKPGRDSSGTSVWAGDATIVLLLLEILVAIVKWLRIPEETKDNLLRTIAALFFGGLMLYWDRFIAPTIWVR